jgi:hypothetical protein
MQKWFTSKNLKEKFFLSYIGNPWCQNEEAISTMRRRSKSQNIFSKVFLQREKNTFFSLEIE